MFARKLPPTVLLCIALAVPGIADADMFGPSHNCFKPHKPFEFNSESQVRQFRNDVEMYRLCINRFIEEQQDAAAVHQDAAGDAIDEWNRFVNFELQ